MAVLLKGEKIVLRSVDFSDVDTILLWENANDEPLYGIYEEQYTREDVAQFVENQQRHSLAENEQLRLVICSHEGERLGCIDLSYYDGRKAFVSILIFDLHNRRKGFGSEALQLLISYAKSLGMRSLYATILPQNEQSLHLFERAGFEDLGTSLYRKKL